MVGLLDRLPPPLRPLSESLSVTENVNSPASEAGEMLPEPALPGALRRSIPARTRLSTALRRVRVAKFFAPSYFDVGFASNISIDGGPCGCRIGCSPIRACPGPKPDEVIDVTPVGLGVTEDLATSR